MRVERWVKCEDQTVASEKLLPKRREAKYHGEVGEWHVNSWERGWDDEDARLVSGR